MATTQETATSSLETAATPVIITKTSGNTTATSIVTTITKRTGSQINESNQQKQKKRIYRTNRQR